MNLALKDFLNIEENIDRKIFLKKYFSLIREDSPVDLFFKDKWYNYQISGIYNYLSDNNSHKWLVVKFDDNDEVLVSIKFVTNFTNVYIRLQHYPISLLSKKNNEDIVFNKLKNFEFIELLWEDESNIDKHKFIWNKRIVDINFYDIVNERWEFLNSKSYMRKRKINRFLKDDEYYLTKASYLDKKIIEDCYKEWCEFKNKKLHNKKLFTKIFKDWDFLVNHSNIEVLLFKYNNIVLGCSIYVKMGDSYQNIIEFSRTTRSCKLNIEEDRFKVFLQGSAQIMNYYHMKYFKDKNVNIVSYAGSIEKDSLYIHKLNNYSKTMKYYSSKIND